MKINKRNPVHWVYLLLLSANVLVAIVLRPLLHRRRTRKVLLYGHKRSGNLLAIHEWVLEHHPDAMEMRYLTMDPAYYRYLRSQGVPCVLAISPPAIVWLATADAIISDHGLHAIYLMLGSTDMKFFDVWHGIPFKGFDASDFRVQRRFDEIWVASPLLAKMYIDRFGFDANRLVATGYARTDRLKKCTGIKSDWRRKFGVPNGKIVLFAPTWKQDSRGRSIFPFGMGPQEFLDALAEVAHKHQATIVLRTHLNSRLHDLQHRAGMAVIPFAKFPETELLLLASDVLICDWSSIAFDYLILGRPTIFLDVPPPFEKGFSLDESYRFGAVTRDLWEVEATLDRYLSNPGHYKLEHGDQADMIRRRIYGGLDDGAAVERCLERLRHHLS